MEPITIFIVGVVYATSAINEEIRKNKAKKFSSYYSSFSSSSSKSSVSVSKPELNKKQEGRICQPEIYLSNNNKIKAE